MGNQEQANAKAKNLKIAIIVLTILLVLSVGALAIRYVYLTFFAPTQSTVTVPDNLIGEENQEPGDTANISEQSSSGSDALTSAQTGSQARPTANTLELYQGKPDDNSRFELTNMLPGDVETKYFCVKAHHEADVELFFEADVTEQTRDLSKVLHIKITHPETGKVLCDAAFSDVEGQEFSQLLKANSDKLTTAYYQIDVSLDTSVGNEYQAAKLTADFKWYVKDDGSLTVPKTGDDTNVTLWVVLAGASLLLILLLFIWKRRKEDERHD